MRRRGHPAQARPILRDAVALADEVRAAAVSDAARAELRLAGGRAHRRALTPVERLTPGERRVAELAAAGRSNRQIANTLFVTVKAVEWHLGNAYRKLDVRGRAELPDVLGIRWGSALGTAQTSEATLDLGHRIGRRPAGWERT